VEKALSAKVMARVESTATTLKDPRVLENRKSVADLVGAHVWVKILSNVVGIVSGVLFNAVRYV
jgi:hypothetical protein